jgi:hypothetical protein
VTHQLFFGGSSSERTLFLLVVSMETDPEEETVSRWIECIVARSASAVIQLVASKTDKCATRDQLHARIELLLLYATTCVEKLAALQHKRAERMGLLGIQGRLPPFKVLLHNDAGEVTVSHTISASIASFLTFFSSFFSFFGDAFTVLPSLPSLQPSPTPFPPANLFPLSPHRR